MNTKMVIAGLIAFLMVSSIAGLVFTQGPTGGPSSFRYNGYKFTPVQNGYRTSIDGEKHTFIFSPQDLEFYELTDDVLSLLNEEVFTVTYEPGNNSQLLAEAQYYFELQLSNVRYIDRGLIDNTNTSLPQRTCADATDKQPVIELAYANISSITVEGNCIKVQAEGDYDLINQVERIIYAVLGVME